MQDSQKIEVTDREIPYININCHYRGALPSYETQMMDQEILREMALAFIRRKNMMEEAKEQTGIKAEET